jgi:Family of unknown function (DUF6152)
MRHRLLLAVTILCGLAFAVAPLIAHHSVAAQFDRTKTVTLTGPVTKLDWINPHARFLMDVKDNEGKVTGWEVELSAPAMLLRRGWTRNAIPIGGTVTVTGPSAKDGSKMIYANSVTLSDGKRVFSGNPEELGGPPQQ